MNKLFFSAAGLCVLTLAGCGNGDDDLLGQGNGGDDTVTLTVDPVAPLGDNLAPEFQNTGIWTYNASNPSLRMYGDYFDAEGDIAGVHELSWYRDGVKIEGETLDYLTLSADDYNTDGSLKAMRGCGIPVARTGTLRGEEVCVDYDANNFVTPPEGDEPPTAEITVSGTQALGNVMSSVYTYASPTSTPEGNSRHVWFAYKLPSGNMPSLVTDDADETICTDASAGKQCDLTITEEIEYAYLYSCVTPEDENGLVGYGDCSDSLTNSGTNVVPSMSNVAISGTPYPGEVLRVSGDYLDLDDDKPGLHLYQWRVDGTPVDGQTQSTLTLDDSMLGSYVTACVTPIALTGRNPGEQVCSEEPGVLVEDPASAPPTAVAEIVTPAPLAGETISAQYSYAQVDNVAEQGSSFTWYREDASGQRTLLKTCDAATAGTACDYESQTFDVGTRIMACVLPKSNEGIVGSESCAYAGVDDGNGNTIVPGIKVTGVFEYNETLTVEKVGDVEGPITWKMNLAAPFDGSNDDPATRTEIPTEQGGVGDSETYYIGTMQYIRDNNLIPDSNANGVIDDADWAANGRIDALEAGYFIGKDITVCVADEKYGDICRDASNFQSATADSCESSSECVTSGLFLDIDDASERGIKSQSIVETSAGEKLYADTSLADLKFRYNRSESQLDEYEQNTRTLLGIDYPTFNKRNTSDYQRMVNHCELITSETGGIAPAVDDLWSEAAGQGIDIDTPIKEENALQAYGNLNNMPTLSLFGSVVRNLGNNIAAETTASPSTGMTFGQGGLTSSSPNQANIETSLYVYSWGGLNYFSFLEENDPQPTGNSLFCTSN